MTKRTFLKTVGASVPALKLMGESGAVQGAGKAPPSGADKFTPLDCTAYFNAAPADFEPRDKSRRAADRRAMERMLRTPVGKQTFHGIPFTLGVEGFQNKSWLALRLGQSAWTATRAEIAVGTKAHYICLAQFCDWDENEAAPAGVEAIEKVGQLLAEATIRYEDGSEQKYPVRRRFEVNALNYPWGHLCFAALPHRQETPRKLTDPVNNAMQQWGDLQMATTDPNYGGSSTLWLCALQNPSPEKTIQALRFDAKSEDTLLVCGITLFHRGNHPLRKERLMLYRISLPEQERGGPWEVSADLGVVARTYQLPPFEPQVWLASPEAGLGESRKAPDQAFLYAEVTATPDATLVLENAKTGRRFEFDLGKAVPGQNVEARPAGPSVQVIERDKAWLRAKVVDRDTGRPTAVRLAFRSKEGRYIPPYGHRAEINTGWFQDYGGDVKRADSSFACVDGTFQVELPAGEVFLEMTKGFEYEPVRRRLLISPDQRELNLEIGRFADFRSKGWVTADSHVHFLSPTTGVLEGQAEGVNLINVLAAQWGDLFTNVGDLSHGPITSGDGETIVWVGTENRQHVLGHIGLLGTRGEPVFPMGSGGPEESYIGTPVWNNMAEWADTCRQREGLVVAVHFPYPTAELAADIVMEKIDAVELWPTSMGEQFNSLRFQDWYRCLNCGYRLPAVAGTDKMGAWISVGAYRGYAHLGQDEFTFANWAKAVRRGNTFMSSGPLLLFQADGRSPGEDLSIGAGGGTVEVRVEMQSAVPVHRLEIVWNGAVVASREDKGGARRMNLHDRVSVSGPGWLAARCASRYVSAGTRVAAHTSPVYVTMPGREAFSAPAAAYLMTLIDGAETWLKTVSIRPDAERHARALKLFTEARQRLHQRMHRNGVPH